MRLRTLQSLCGFPEARSDFLICSCESAIKIRKASIRIGCGVLGGGLPSTVLNHPCRATFKSNGGRSGRRNGDYYGDLCTPVTGSNLKSPSQVFDPLAHASQTEPMSTGSLDDL